jgi:hypothetical protein
MLEYEFIEKGKKIKCITFSISMITYFDLDFFLKMKFGVFDKSLEELIKRLREKVRYISVFQFVKKRKCLPSYSRSSPKKSYNRVII